MNDKFNIFGKNHSVVGDSTSDILLRTKGKIKIQVGNKFIDLLNDGKLNSDFKFIYVIDSIDSIKNKDGIYITNDGYVYLKSGNNIVNISSKDFNTTYISFMEKQYTTSQQKYLALQNIGFLYNSLSDINENSLQNGIIYVQSEQKLYTVLDGKLSELEFVLPDIITKQFIIEKNDSQQGSLVIRGDGTNNSIAFDSMYIYTNLGESYINSDGNINFIINNSTVLSMNNDKASIYTPIECNTFQSYKATNTYGFRLYYSNGKSTLEVDNLVVRNGLDTNSCSIYPIYTSYKVNQILSIQQLETDIQQSETKENFQIYLKYSNQYSINDIVYTYCEVPNETSTDLVLITFSIIQVDTESNSIVVQSNSLSSYTRFLSSLNNKFLFIDSSENYLTLRYTESNIDLLESINNVQRSVVKIGDISQIEAIQESSTIGIYSENAYFNSAKYTPQYELKITDNSTNMASTEWVHKLLPKGSIIMFNGQEDIPEGWVICDGSNGTPNLINRFIMGSTTIEESTDIDSTEYPISLTSENIPTSYHTHNVQFNQQEVEVTIPEHTHSLLYVTTSKAKRVETGDGEGAQNYHFAGIGSIYKSGESWSQNTGTGGIVQSNQWDGSALVSPVQLSGSATMQSNSTVTSTPNESSTTFNIKYPRYYKLIFIMKIV